MNTHILHAAHTDSFLILIATTLIARCCMGKDSDLQRSPDTLLSDIGSFRKLGHPPNFDPHQIRDAIVFMGRLASSLSVQDSDLDVGSQIDVFELVGPIIDGLPWYTAELVAAAQGCVLWRYITTCSACPDTTLNATFASLSFRALCPVFLQSLRHSGKSDLRKGPSLPPSPCFALLSRRRLSCATAPRRRQPTAFLG